MTLEQELTAFLLLDAVRRQGVDGFVRVSYRASRTLGIPQGVWDVNAHGIYSYSGFLHLEDYLRARNHEDEDR